MNTAGSQRYKARRGAEQKNTSASVSAVLGLAFDSLRRIFSPLKSGCAAGIAVLFVLSALLPGIVSGGCAGYDMTVLYAAVGMFYTLLFMALSLTDVHDSRYDAVDIMYYAPFPPFLLLFVRTLRRLVPTISIAGLLFVFSFGAMHALFGVGMLFFILCAAGFAVTAVLGVLMLTALHTLEVIFGFRHSAVRIIFALLMSVWVTAAVVLTPDSGTCGRLCSALVSPFGTTIPVGGWLCAVIMGICEGSFWTLVPGALLCPSFAAMIIMLLFVMNDSQYDLALTSMLDSERHFRLFDRFDAAVVKLSDRAAGLIPISGKGRNSDGAEASDTGSASVSGLFCASLYRIINERGYGFSRRLFGGFNTAFVCFIAAAVLGRQFDASFAVCVTVSIFVLSQIASADASLSDSSGCSVSGMLNDLAAAVYELGGCAAGAVVSILPAALIFGASGGTVLLGILLAAVLSAAAVLAFRILSRPAAVCCSGSFTRITVLSAAAAVAAVIMAAAA